MKKAFTLVELLVVVVVLTMLMAIVFRIGNFGDESKRRAVTIDRIQRLENALSGYFAAYGMYPPVRLHGQRNIYLKVNGSGLQSDEGEENENIWGWINSDGTGVRDGERESIAWQQVRAACVAQPVACEFPFEGRYRDLIQAASEELKAWAEQSEVMTEAQRAVCMAGFDDGVTENIGRHRANRDKLEWEDIQLFKFGLMSYLLPRYLVMMNGDRTFFTDYAQWTGNNREPSDPINGHKMGWEDVQRYANSDNNSDMMRVANMPSQAVCARWMANFEKALSCNMNRKLFGVQVRGDDLNAIPYWFEGENSGSIVGDIYRPGGYDGGNSGNYILDCITMRDGWEHDLYYYSPEPYQGYVLWSAGPNGRTFPPWISRESLPSDGNRCVSYWTKDDISGLKN